MEEKPNMNLRKYIEIHHIAFLMPEGMAYNAIRFNVQQQRARVKNSDSFFLCEERRKKNLFENNLT